MIDCVLSHLQPAFDHPELRGQKPLVIFCLFPLKFSLRQKEKKMKRSIFLHYSEKISFSQDPPARPKGDEREQTATESLQLWTDSGESCPEGTVPIRRTTEKDILRASSIKRFGRKLRRHVRRDSTGGGHEVSTNFENILLFIYSRICCPVSYHFPFILFFHR